MNITTLTEIEIQEIEDSFKAEGYGVDVDEVTFTQESLVDFRAGQMSFELRGAVAKQTDKVLVVVGAQVAKGQQRTDYCVIDFGNFRAVYK